LGDRRLAKKGLKYSIYQERGDTGMGHFIINCGFTLVALGLAYFTFRRWYKKKGLWYILSAVAFILSAPVFWLSQELGLLFFVPAGLLFLLGELSRTRRQSKEI
jgi:hypothetical protein